MQPITRNPPEISIRPSNSEWEGLLNRVIDSPPFRRSARLRDFLVYVGNEVVVHGVEDLPEQQIGTAVFGRSPLYDTSQDNIVRVNAMELRKRIDLYFANEGKDEPLVFEIPRGSYLPIFHQRQAAPLETVPDEELPLENVVTLTPVPSEPVPSDAVPGRLLSVFRNPISFFLLFVIVGLAVALVGEIRRNQQAQLSLHKWQSGPALQAFWGNFFGKKLAPEIVVADMSFGIAQDVLHKKLSLQDYLDYSYRSAQSPDTLSNEARRQQDSDLSVIFNRSMASLGDFRVARRITELETGDYGTRLSFAREYAAHRLRWSNTIFVGSSRSNPWVELFDDRLSYHFNLALDSTPSSITVDHPTGNEQGEYPVSSATGTRTSYCLIVFLPNPTNTGNTLIVAGTDSQATEVGGDFLTSEEDLQKLQGLFLTKAFPYFQVLLRISRSNGTPLESEIISYRVIKKP